MARSVLIPLDNGFEEIEFSAILDVLRRAELDVTVAGLGDVQKTRAHGLKIFCDETLERVTALADAIVLPGGLPGAQHLAESDLVMARLKAHAEAGKITAALCAAPWALGNAGLLEGKTATCYPGFEDKLIGATPSEDRVVVDGTVTTSRGPGTAIEFALALVAQLVDQETAEALHAGMLVASP